MKQQEFTHVIVTLLLFSLLFIPNQIHGQESYNRKIDSFLLDPIDYVKFCKLKKYFNDGGQKIPNYYRPKSYGFYYTYFLFMPPGSNGNHESTEFTVYKFGKIVTDVGIKEELIEFSSEEKNPLLGEANFVCLKPKDIIDKYGEPDFKSDTLLLYRKNEIHLILSINNKKIEWFKWVRLNFQIENFENLPSILTKLITPYKK